MTILQIQGGFLVVSGNLLLVQPSANQFRYYISPTGNDANLGTLNSPWSIRSLLNPLANTSTATSRANQLAMAGNRVGIIGDQGPYAVWSMCGSPNLTAAPGGVGYTQAMLLVPEGNASNQTLVQSCTSTGQPAGPHLAGTTAAMLNGGLTDGNNSGTNTGSAVIGHHGNVGYVNIVGLEITGFNSFGVGCGNWGGSIFPVGVNTTYNYIHDSSGNGSGVNISGITYRGVRGSGFGIGAADSVQANNYITRIVDTSGLVRANGIENWACDGVSMKFNTMIATSTVGDCAGTLHWKNAAQWGNRTYNNFIDVSAAAVLQSGMITDDEDNTGPSPPYSKYVQNNIINMGATGNVGCFWGIAGVPNMAAVGTQQFYRNNTIVGGTTGIFRMGSALTMTGYNNIFTSASFGGGYGYWLLNANAPTLLDYNCYNAAAFDAHLVPAGTNGSAGNTNYATLALWRAAIAAGQPACVGQDAHSIQHNPSFSGVGPYAGAWKLQPGDACLTAGSSDGTVGGSAAQMGAWGGTDTDTGGAVTQIGAIWLQ